MLMLPKVTPNSSNFFIDSVSLPLFLLASEAGQITIGLITMKWFTGRMTFLFLILCIPAMVLDLAILALLLLNFVLLLVIPPGVSYALVMVTGIFNGVLYYVGVFMFTSAIGK